MSEENEVVKEEGKKATKKDSKLDEAVTTLLFGGLVVGTTNFNEAPLWEKSFFVVGLALSMIACALLVDYYKEKANKKMLIFCSILLALILIGFCYFIGVFIGEILELL